MLNGKTITLVAAMAANRAIGLDGAMPWHLPRELKHFRDVTMGKPIVMGRKTWESIGRPLPKRTNIVVSRSLQTRDDILLAGSLDEALALARESAASRAYVIGGARLYQEALGRAERLELTRVHAEVEGDVTFPAFDEAAYRIVRSEEHPADERHEHAFCFESWLRR